MKHSNRLTGFASRKGLLGFSVILAVVLCGVYPSQGAVADESERPWGAIACSTTGCPSAVPITAVDGNQRIADALGAAKPGEFPWMVAIGHFSDDKTFNLECGGSLIHPHWVLTAAHCVVPTGYVVLGGRLTLTKAHGDQATVDANTPWDFDAKLNSRHDLSLLHLKESLSYQTASLGRVAHFGEAGHATLRILGWGSASYRSPISGVLLFTDIRTVENQICNKLYGDYDQKISVPPGSFCAIGNGEADKTGHVADACPGDSGGPAIAMVAGSPTQLVGVVSGGIGCGSAALPGMYAQVAEAIPWIEGELKKQGDHL